MKTVFLAFALTGCGLSLRGEDLPQIDSGPQLTAVRQEPTKDAQAHDTVSPERDSSAIETATPDADAPEASTPEATIEVEAAIVEASVPTDVITYCLGCLDDRGVCYPGTMTTACGKNGQKCVDCTTAGLQHVCGSPNPICL